MDYKTQVLNSPAYDFVMPPMEHQAKALYLSGDEPDFAYFMEMGTGKTKVAIDNAVHLYLKGLIQAVLVMAPKGAYMNWSSVELPKHTPKTVRHRVLVWSSLEKDQVALTRQFASRSGELVFLIFNVESMSMGRGPGVAKDFLMANPRTMWIIDESTCIKNYNSKRSKNILALRRYANYRRILTGDPLTRSPMDIYGQCSFLGADKLGFSSPVAFRSRYCTIETKQLRDPKTGKITREFPVITGTQRIDELKAKITRFSYRVLKSECLDLPPKVYVTREVPLTDEQRKIIRTLKKEAIAYFDSVPVVTAPLVLTRLIKQHQVVCGYLKTDTGDEIAIANNRLSALMETLEETDGKVLIWANYRYNIKEIYEAISKEYGPESVVHYFGDTTGEERPLAVNRFNNDPTCRYFVGNPATGRYSLTLTVSSTCIYYSNSYNMEFRNQSEDRIHRIGQSADKVTYVDLISRRTADEVIIQNLKSKRDMANDIVGGSTAWKNWFID